MRKIELAPSEKPQPQNISILTKLRFFQYTREIRHT